MRSVAAASRRRMLLAEGWAESELEFAERVDRAAELILGPEPKPGPNAAQVGPDARYKLRGILKHYATKAHPFAACVRDNRKRFGPRAEAVCAVVKDLIRGTTHWRGHNNPADKGSAGLAGLSEERVIEAYLIDDEVADALAMLKEDPVRFREVLDVLNGFGIDTEVDR